MHKVTKRAAEGVHLGVRVCVSFTSLRTDGDVASPSDSPLPSDKAPNGVAPRAPSGGPPAAAPAPAAAAAALGKAPTGRDPKSRARSREYLKQCLQEISYLTSPQAMNPLPNRPLISNPNPSMGAGGNAMNPSAPGGVGLSGIGGGMGGIGQGQGIAQGQGPSPFDAIYNGRPRKQLPETTGPGISGVSAVPSKEFPMLGTSTGSGAMGVMSGPASAPATSGALERSNPLAIAGAGMYQQQQQAPAQTQPQQSQENQVQRNLAPSQPPTQPQTQPAQQQQQDGIGQTPAFRQDGDVPKLTTMIFRPDDAGEWKEKLRTSYEQVQQWRETEDEEPEVGEEDEETESDGVVDETDGESTKLWKAKRTLRKCVFDLYLVIYLLTFWFSSHLDAVRALAFHPTELCLATGGDDCTVKIWRMDVASLAPTCVDSFCPPDHSSCVYSARVTTESEPQLTLRGHSAAITRLVHSPTRQLLYSASLDSSIRVWALPSPSHTTYAPYDESSSRGELVGHTDAVWDLALVRDESTLVSCGAEGTVKVWDVGGPGAGSLRLSWGYSGLEREGMDGEDEKDGPGATAIEAIKTDLKKVAVAYQNAVVKIFDIETGKEVSRLATDATYGESIIHSTQEFIDGLNHLRRRDACDPSEPTRLTSDNVFYRHCSRGQVYPHL